MEYFVLENEKHIIYLARIKLNFRIRGVFAPDETDAQFGREVQSMNKVRCEVV